MSKPLTLTTWATATTYATSADPTAVGQPTKTDPASIAAQGWDYATRPDPTMLNFWQNAVGKWCSWVNTDVLDTTGATYDLAANPITLTTNGVTFDAGATMTVTPSGGFAVASLVYAHVLTGVNFTFDSGAHLNLDAGSDITGDPDFTGGTWTWSSPQDVSSTVRFQGTGHKLDRVITGAGGNATYAIANADEVLVPNLSADITYTLSTTGAATGARMRFSAYANVGTKTATVVTAEGTYFLSGVVGGGTNTGCLDVVCSGAAWHTSCATPV